MTKQDKKRKTSLGVLFWIAAILLILVVFLFNRSNIEQVMESTGLVEVINQRIGMDGDAPADESFGEEETDSTDEQASQEGVQEDNSSQDAAEDGPSQSDAPSENSSDAGSDSSSGSESDGQGNEESGDKESGAESEQDRETAPDRSEESARENAENGENRETEDGAEPDVQTKVREYSIFMVHINDAGDISVQPENMEVEFATSPLTRTLETLFEQPQEKAGGSIRNLIPSRSRIHRVWVEDGIAYIDVNESFRFNPIGMEGHRLQLAQLINTATQFPTVDGIRILIDGESYDFLGGEGTYIGKALYPGDYP
ncbi:GerMN domain-containing protein [Salinispira pacifica]|uniref:GerMN domain-containing protein n=1 Tax=Salinispira pacifica TaxID=1307761 RepID=V5WHU3_9SPIO|nr:GerMN domain-containing protein [Salinispira pacifica]AHC14741.1 hypothetical protein L21SP2_1342 [Salinispira pacifica]